MPFDCLLVRPTEVRLQEGGNYGIVQKTVEDSLRNLGARRAFGFQSANVFNIGANLMNMLCMKEASNER